MGTHNRSVAGFWLTAALVIAGGCVSACVFVQVAGIENDEAEYTRLRGAFRAAVLGSLLVLGFVLVVLHESTFLPIRRAARWTAWAVVAAACLWFAPVPFGVHRYMLLALVLSGSALLGVGAMRAGGLPPRSAGPLGALGATAGACGVILQLKLDSLGWAAAID
jgi:hypothetical protein